MGSGVLRCLVWAWCLGREDCTKPVRVGPLPRARLSAHCSCSRSAALTRLLNAAPACCPHTPLGAAHCPARLQEVAWDPTGRYVATIVNAGECLWLVCTRTAAWVGACGLACRGRGLAARAGATRRSRCAALVCNRGVACKCMLLKPHCSYSQLCCGVQVHASQAPPRPLPPCVQRRPWRTASRCGASAGSHCTSEWSRTAASWGSVSQVSLRSRRLETQDGLGGVAERPLADPMPLCPCRRSLL